MVNDIKKYLRIKSPVFDLEIQGLIAECKKDLINSGINETKVNSNDPLILRAIVTYAKAEFGLDNPNRNKLLKSYESMKSKLVLTGGYR